MLVSKDPRCKKKAEQEKLSGVLKDVHKKLRRKCRDGGDFDAIWQEHCEDEQTLATYALAMKNLADNYWAKSCEGQGRIEWCHSSMSKMGKIRLLDVGSCYNPFLTFEEFLTVGIDIVPAVESVYKCDFLNLQLQKPLQPSHCSEEGFVHQLHSPIHTLPAHLFHVVVFSLLLSYFPSPNQRWLCCKKAQELLELNGLLLIITPDSSHENRHALMMRSWRLAVESLGFRRYKYIKSSHMHLIAFRKVSLATTSDLMSSNYSEMLYIPQDFQSNEEEDCAGKPVEVRSDLENDQLAESFTELPNIPWDLE